MGMLSWGPDGVFCLEEGQRVWEAGRDTWECLGSSRPWGLSKAASDVCPKQAHGPCPRHPEAVGSEGTSGRAGAWGELSPWNEAPPPPAGTHRKRPGCFVGVTHSYSVFRPGSSSSFSTLSPFIQRWPMISVSLLLKLHVRYVLEPSVNTEVEIPLPGRPSER